MSSTNDSQSRSGPPPTRSGVPFDIATSALIKALRRGQEEDAVAWATELFESGFVAHTWRRLLISACEDHGLGEPMLAVQVNALHDIALKLAAKKADRSRADRLPFIQAVLAISRARKSREVDDCLIWAFNTRAPLPVIEEDSDVLDKHTTVGARDLRRGWAHFWSRSTLLVNEAGELVREPVPDRYRSRAIEATGGKP